MRCFQSSFVGDAIRLGMAIGCMTIQERRLLGFPGFLRLLLVVAAVVFSNVVDYQTVRNAEDEEQPEEVKSLQTSQQGETNVLGNPALELLASPVKLKRSDGAKLGKN